MLLVIIYAIGVVGLAANFTDDTVELSKFSQFKTRELIVLSNYRKRRKLTFSQR